MTRVSSLGRDDVPARLHGIFDEISTYGPFASLVGAMAHRPPLLEHVFRMLIELRHENVLARRYLELALVTVSKLNACAYCVAHHGPMLRVEGVSAAGVDRLLDYQDHPELDAVDKLVVAYAALVTEGPNRVRDDVFERLRRHFSQAQIVELTWRIALCGAFNRFNDVLQLDIEPEAAE